MFKDFYKKDCIYVRLYMCCCFKPLRSNPFENQQLQSSLKQFFSWPSRGSGESAGPIVNLQESFVDKSRWTVRDLLEDSQWPVPLFMLQFVDDQIRFEWQTLFAPIFHNAHSSRFESFRNHGISTLPIFDHAWSIVLQTLNDQTTYD